MTEGIHHASTAAPLRDPRRPCQGPCHTKAPTQPDAGFVRATPMHPPVSTDPAVFVSEVVPPLPHPRLGSSPGRGARDWAGVRAGVQALALLVALSACGASGGATTGSARGRHGMGDASHPQSTETAGATHSETSPGPAPIGDASQDGADRDLLSMDLTVRLGTNKATALIEMAGGPAGARFEARDLDVSSVDLLNGTNGTPVAHAIREGILHIAVPASETTQTLVIEYGFPTRAELEGATDRGVSMLWPYHCGALFPCDSKPSDGLRLSLTVEPAAATDRVITTGTLGFDAPSYMLAWAVGPYTETKLGTTAAGSEIVIFTRDDAELRRTQTGTERLAAAFDWLERTLGRYPYGPKAGTVAVSWGGGAYGGMEHHPFWHVDARELHEVEVHVHEAAHGWFGNAVRLACWEDLVLSEGLATYLSARAIEAVYPPEDKDKVTIWPDIERRHERARGKIAWLPGCNEHDVLKDGLFSQAVYATGALTMRDIEAKIGREVMDRGLYKFVSAYRGRPAHITDLIATLEAESGADLKSLVTDRLGVVFP